MNRRISTRKRSSSNKSKQRYYPRHFTVNGQAYIGETTAIKHVPADKQITTTLSGEPLDELKVGDMVIFGERDAVKIKVAGERYFIAYRNRLVKISE